MDVFLRISRGPEFGPRGSPEQDAAETLFRGASAPAKSAGNRRSGLGRGQDLGAGARDIGVGGLAARHQGKAALLDEIAAVPAARLGELGHLGGGIALRAK